MSKAITLEDAVATYALRWERNGIGYVFRGAPFVLEFDERWHHSTIELAYEMTPDGYWRMITLLYNGTERRVDAECIDLPTGDTFSLEFCPGYIRFYLWQGRCSLVTLLRFVTNMEMVAGSVRLEVGGDEVTLQRLAANRE